MDVAIGSFEFTKRFCKVERFRKITGELGGLGEHGGSSQALWASRVARRSSSFRAASASKKPKETFGTTSEIAIEPSWDTFGGQGWSSSIFITGPSETTVLGRVLDVSRESLFPVDIWEKDPSTEGTMDLNGKGGKLKMELPSSPRASRGKDNDNAHSLTLSNRSSGSTPAKSRCLLSDKKLPEESSKLEDITDKGEQPKRRWI